MGRGGGEEAKSLSPRDAIRVLSSCTSACGKRILRFFFLQNASFHFYYFGSIPPSLVRSISWNDEAGGLRLLLVKHTAATTPPTAHIGASMKRERVYGGKK